MDLPGELKPGTAAAVMPPATPQLHYFGDYELIREIARGGMGVVYRARQLSLNRVVAVKMILSGQLANETEVKRFRIEAEAAANLQHPHIVAIHEIGEHEGQHYFSMDFIEGVNLADYTKTHSLSSLEIAQLMQLLAEAVQYAHQRGTLHRDLKPPNILVDAKGLPHITDFGLAKRWDAAAPAGPAARGPGPEANEGDRKVSFPAAADSGLTAAGAIMGSPSYMAPEQAAGRAGEIGPATDVYSLGAILYELLTSQPPHRGLSVYDTITKVIAEEPTAPRRLNPDVPEDLETICLKCLEKKPGRRYATARMVGEDLERFLNREPILARRASFFRRLESGVRRRPWALVATGGTLLMAAIFLAYGSWQLRQHDRRQALIERAKGMALMFPTEIEQREKPYIEGMKLLQEAIAIRPDDDITVAAVLLLGRSGKGWRHIEHTHGSGRGIVRAMTTSADGRFLAAAFRGGAIEIFDVTSGRRVFAATGPDLEKPLLALSGDGTWLAAAFASQVSGNVHLWHWSIAASPIIFPAHGGELTALAFSRTGGPLATAGAAAAGRKEPEIAFWDPAQPSVPVQRISRTQPDPIFQLAFNQAGSFLAATTAAQTDLFRRGADGTAYDPVPAHRRPAEKQGRGSFTADGTGWIDGDLSRFDLETRRVENLRPKKFPGYLKNTLPLIVSSDGRYLAQQSVAVDSSGDGDLVRMPLAVWRPGPDGSLAGCEPLGSAFVYWKPEHVVAEWKRLGLSEALHKKFILAGSEQDMEVEQLSWRLVPGIYSLMLMMGLLAAKPWQRKRVIGPGHPARHFGRAPQLALWVSGAVGLAGLVFAVYGLLWTAHIFAWEVSPSITPALSMGIIFTHLGGCSIAVLGASYLERRRRIWIGGADQASASPARR